MSPNQIGKLIVVSGRSGSGKSTLIGFALKQLANIEYLKTYTTRPERIGDIGYEYLSHEEYLEKAQNSSNWDHSEVHNNFYGADLAEALNKTAKGTNLIVTSLPDIKELQNFSTAYPCEVVSVFIEISENESRIRIARERPSTEMIRVQKETEMITPEVILSFNKVFKPEGIIQRDIANFNKLLNDIIYEK